MNERDRSLWKHLKGVEEFKHKNWHEPGLSKLCFKCEQYYGDGGSNSGICSEPDPYKGSDADVAEEIRVWLEKAEDDDFAKYYFRLHKRSGIERVDRSGFTDWLLAECTPADRIDAFIEMMKGAE